MAAVKRKMPLHFHLSLAPALAGLIEVLFTAWRTAGAVLVPLSVPAVFALLRCPYCRRYLGNQYVYGKYCPHCGKKLE